MATKLTAGRIATAAGCTMVICNSNAPENIVRIAHVSALAALRRSRRTQPGTCDSPRRIARPASLGSPTLSLHCCLPCSSRGPTYANLQIDLMLSCGVTRWIDPLRAGRGPPGQQVLSAASQPQGPQALDPVGAGQVRVCGAGRLHRNREAAEPSERVDPIIYRITYRTYYLLPSYCITCRCRAAVDIEPGAGIAYRRHSNSTSIPDCKNP